jgi:integrase/recombinase XerD
MASVKIVLRKKINKDGTYPLAVRITKDRKSSFMHLGHHVEEAYWDDKNNRVRKSHPNSVRLNNLLAKKLAEAEDSLLDLEVGKNDVSSLLVKRRMKSAKGSSFFALANAHLANLKEQGNFNVYKCDVSRMNGFKRFLNDGDTSFQDITVALLNRYRAYLKGTRQVGEQTVINYLRFIQSIYNKAIKEQIVDRRYYPFGRENIVLKSPRSMKIGLTVDEVKILENLPLKNTNYLYHARNVWLVSFYFAGMRASDALRLKWTDFQSGRLYYSMGKNDKPGTLKVPEKAERILSEYRDQKNAHNLVFPDLAGLPDLSNKYAVQERIATIIPRLDVSLHRIAKKAGITKKLTMHISRHTFGNISGDKIPIQMLQKLYRHTDIATTIGYQANFIHKDTDEALDLVIDF